MRSTLDGQRIAVLGGSSGIGLATAKAAQQAGAKVTIVSRKPPAGFAAHAADLADPAAIAEAFDTIGEIDHLVYTAGEPLELMTLNDFDRDRARSFFGLRYFSVLDAVKAARVTTSITLTTGIAKDRPGPGWAVAASICGAVEALTKALAIELAPLRVNAVSPGVVRSPLWGPDAEQLYTDVGRTLPLRRVGEVEEIAHAYLYLMTQPWATGTILTVDGGTTIA
ncbi:NAD(P)-dependent dehydrogenase (short-subunit alcohol dehydrogenase family) [Lentzea atacamensis]|uniref:NAD(P)-dependent dehydrogenase (Short-subunit alcohol dehydrogenase family) n=1 Tax=Lentzea atacamensis TaxID=531938 RepID=A0ABX9EDD4_9PSEU|nr:SDR family oxidoreductase [Lentzea atacamensis]RAS67221.1 NAD(P)-dependent dehydrogenase (short-subunit alcohol dehydrogenase family) [Lentzea atacamensis]